MPNQEENNASQEVPKQNESSILSVDALASMLETQSFTGQTTTDATESDTQSVEDQNRELDNPLAEELQPASGIDNRSRKNSAEEADSSDLDEESGIPKHIQKRIDKITAKRREAEAEAERLRSELEQLRTKKDEPVVPRNKNPFANIVVETDLQTALDQARKVRDWCEENPYGGEIPKGNGEFITVDETEVRKMKVNALKDIETNIPAQLQFINARRHFDPIAEKEYPWWQKKDSKEYHTAVGLLKNFPELAQFPDYKLVIGDFVFGMASRTARKVKESAQTQVRRPQLQPSRPSIAPSANSNNTQKAQEIEQRFTKTGSRDDLASLIEARLMSR